MAEPAVYHLAVEPEEPHTADTAQPETAPLTEAFTAILDLSQDVKQAACPGSEETEKEKSEPIDGQTDVTPSSPQSKAWLPGSRCRAVYAADGLVYPAVLQWVRGERCCVRFDFYDNEEETNVSELLRVDELHGPARANAARSNSLRFIPPSINSDWKRRRRREDAPTDKGPETKVKDEFPPQNKVDEDPEKPASQGFGFVPPFPPPPQTNSGDWPSFLPPPPIWTFGGKDSAADSMSNMLILWYMCGFHTGSYMTQQKFKSKD